MHIHTYFQSKGNIRINCWSCLQSARICVFLFPPRFMKVLIQQPPQVFCRFVTTLFPRSKQNKGIYILYHTNRMHPFKFSSKSRQEKMRTCRVVSSELSFPFRYLDMHTFLQVRCMRLIDEDVLKITIQISKYSIDKVTLAFQVRRIRFDPSKLHRE